MALEKEDREPRVIVADRMFDGTERDPLVDAAVVWQGGRVVSVGARKDVAIPHNATILEGSDWTVLPGLIDTHVHLAKPAGPHLERKVMMPQSLKFLYAVPNSAATLRAGVTTVRDAGFTPAGVRMAVERGLFPGPRMQVAVTILSQTGGHTDEYMPGGGFAPFVGSMDVPPGVVDGVLEMQKRVREILRAGADWIKLCTTGGVLSPIDLPDVPHFTIDELQVAVHEARSHGKDCMAHAIGPQGIKNALRAGVRSIEHGQLLDEECIQLFLEEDAYLVPTLITLHDILDLAEKYPGSMTDFMVQKARELSVHHAKAVRAAIDAGVKIAMGTDSNVGDHGDNLREIPLLVECGMSPLDAIRAATEVGAEMMRIVDQVGTIEVGKRADIAVMCGDPFTDVKLFNDPGRVALVIKDGEVVYSASHEREEVA